MSSGTKPPTTACAWASLDARPGKRPTRSPSSCVSTWRRSTWCRTSRGSPPTIDALALETARRGIYPVGIADYVSPERLERFFVKQDHTYQVQKELREMCLFTVHSLIKDPPFSRLDLFSCRNVLIYLGPELQQKLVRLFHYALRPGGYLFLGPAETLSGQRELFRPLDQQHRIFQKMGHVAHALVEFPLTNVHSPVPQPGAEPERTYPTAARQLGPRIERMILDHYTPACVI